MTWCAKNEAKGGESGSPVSAVGPVDSKTSCHMRIADRRKSELFIVRNALCTIKIHNRAQLRKMSSKILLENGHSMTGKTDLKPLSIFSTISHTYGP